MIKNQWYAVLESREIQQNKALLTTRLGEKMVFWRDNYGTIKCIADKCCHRGASIGCGKVVDGNIECPFHGFQYEGTGKVVLIPANGKNAPVPDYYKVKRYRVKESFGFVWLWWGEESNSLPEIEFLDDLNEGFSFSSFSDHWPVHYTRAIENQLDVVHVPFVHNTTIGRGNRTLVNGPVVIREDKLLKFFVKNSEDDGKTIPQKPSEIKQFRDLPELHFRFPNVWQNVISDKVRVTAAFVPVDDENTVMYIRFYQKISKIPGIKQLINFFGIRMSRVILNQDKRVVITQRPLKSELKMDEKLIQGDLPIIEYRKLRDDLIKKNNI